MIKTVFLYYFELMGIAEKDSLEYMCQFIAKNTDEKKLHTLFEDDVFEISFDKLQIALWKRPIDVFDRICGREKWHSDSGQVVGAALQIELPPTGGLLDKNLGIADIPVRRRVA